MLFLECDYPRMARCCTLDALVVDEAAREKVSTVALSAAELRLSEVSQYLYAAKVPKCTCSSQSFLSPGERSSDGARGSAQLEGSVLLDDFLKLRLFASVTQSWSKSYPRIQTYIYLYTRTL